MTPRHEVRKIFLVVCCGPNTHADINTTFPQDYIFERLMRKELRHAEILSEVEGEL
jgi:hypothetical protein